jgi:hypothetical protein
MLGLVDPGRGDVGCEKEPYIQSFGLKLADPNFLFIPSVNKTYESWEILGLRKMFFPDFLPTLLHTKCTWAVKKRKLVPQKVWDNILSMHLFP